MNVKRLGIQIHENELGQKYVLPEDLKLALDRDVYERLVSKTAKIVADGLHTGFALEWVEMQ